LIGIVLEVIDLILSLKIVIIVINSVKKPKAMLVFERMMKRWEKLRITSLKQFVLSVNLAERNTEKIE
jgi:hypothetical protein